MNRFARYTALAAVLALVTSTSYAQNNASGTIFGRVVGSSASDLAGATATLKSTEFNLTRTTGVSSVGSFDFVTLPVGEYEITLTMKGREPITQAAHVGLSTTTSVRFEPGATDTLKLEKLTVSSSSSSPVDVAATVIGLNIRAETIQLLPVGRDITSVAMLTPGVTKGDTGFFGNLASIGGASVGENAYYINGFNISDVRRVLGYSTVPFNFYNEFQVMTSGYSAEFGRSTGGVVNGISKRGTNTYKASAGIVWTPAGLVENGFDSYRTTGKLYIVRSIARSESKTYNIEASGPLWKNHLYFYGLYQGRDAASNGMAGTAEWDFSKTKDPFWAGKVDWQITPNHSLEYTAFSDKGTTTTQRFSYPLVSDNNAFTRPAALGRDLGNNYFDGGGRNNIYRYTGSFLDNTLTVTALYGTNLTTATSRTDVSGQPYVVDNRGTTSTLSGAQSISLNEDRRNAKRLDGSYRFSLLGSHSLKFGYDSENNKSFTLARASGPDGARYVYDLYTAGSVLANGAVAPAGTTQTASISVYRTGGNYRTISEAYYLEDNWKLMEDRLSLNLGIRKEMFDDRNQKDVTFIKLSNMKAPRISASYDLKGDGLSKVFGSWGRYYQGIPSNTAVRSVGGEIFYTDYYVLNSLKPDFTPNLGAQIGPRFTTGPGIPIEPETITNSTIKPMYQDEFTVGYERALGKKWKASITGIYRNLASVTEDEAVDAALNVYAKAKGYSNFDATGFDFYVITNPGKDLNFYVNMKNDLNGDGVVDVGDQDNKSKKELVHIDAKDLGYPAATRYYYAVQLQLDHKFVDKWFGSFSYVWMHEYGNYEGSVYSDIGQGDAGITQLFDQPGLVDGTYGNLPNDRRHTFKAYGGYQITKQLLLSANFVYQSGRPINSLGLHPTDLFARGYGAASMYRGGVLTPRGSAGRTPWLCNIDLSAKYKPTWGKDKISFGMDIFNVPNWQTTTGVREQSELSNGTPDNRYKKARTIQTPRSVRFSMTLDY